MNSSDRIKELEKEISDKRKQLDIIRNAAIKEWENEIRTVNLTNKDIDSLISYFNYWNITNDTTRKIRCHYTNKP